MHAAFAARTEQTKTEIRSILLDGLGTDLARPIHRAAMQVGSCAALLEIAISEAEP
jgi:hypothetical protein